jgi:hypothetical protein
MIWIKRHLFFCVALVLLTNACKKREFFSEIPAIEYKGHYFLVNSQGKDSLVALIFSFKDGDGDLGLNQGDTLPPFNPVTDAEGNSLNPYYYNMFIDYKEQRNGEFKHITLPFSSDTFKYEYRFPSLTPEGRHLAIRGDIEVKLQPSPFPDRRDTVKYIFYVLDRKLNKSNTVETPPVIWLNR